MNRKELSRGLTVLIILFFLSASVHAQSSIEYDIVLTDGRVIDPETKMDTIKNVGIMNNRIGRYKLGNADPNFVQYDRRWGNSA